MPLAPFGDGGIAAMLQRIYIRGSHGKPEAVRRSYLGGSGVGALHCCQQSVLRSFMIWIYNLGVVTIFSYATFIREFSMWTWVLALLLMASSDKELEK